MDVCCRDPDYKVRELVQPLTPPPSLPQDPRASRQRARPEASETEVAADYEDDQERRPEEQIDIRSNAPRQANRRNGYGK